MKMEKNIKTKKTSWWLHWTMCLSDNPSSDIILVESYYLY